MANLRLAFMGTPEFAVPSLAALIAAGHRLARVYCQPPRRSGRGQKLRPSPVQRFAEGRGIKVCTPASLKPPAEAGDLAALGLDAVVVAAYGLILPPPILQAPRLGCLNVHASLLPRWRGAAPIQHAILAGDSGTGISIMMMDQGLDTGPVLIRGSLPIAADATAGTLHDALAEIGARLVVAALDGLAAGGLAATPQAGEGITHAPKLGPEAGRLDWSRPAAELERRVRAFAPRPGAWFAHGDARVKVLAAAREAGDGAPGQVLDAGLAVACGAGALRLTRLQRPGKAAMEAAEFLRGYALAPGTVLG